MPVNTLKALKERRDAALKKMQEAHTKLKANPQDTAARSEFDGANSEIAALGQQIADEERIAEVELEIRGLNPGQPDERGGDRVLSSRTEKDDPIAFLDSSRYSVLRCVDALAEGRQVDGYEGEISQELARRFGKTANGWLIPLNLRMSAGPAGAERRDLDTSTGAGGLDVVQERRTLIEALRNRAVTPQMGATVLSDMVGTFELPKVTAVPSFSWVGESAGAGSGSNPTLGKVTFAPTTVTAWSVISRRFRKQTSISAENFVRMELLKSLGLAVDYGALAGSGSSNQPTGLINNGSVNTIALGTNGAALTWADIVNFETLVASDNADIGAMGYVFNCVTRGKMKTTVKVSGHPVFLWENGDTPVNGYRAMASNQLPSNLTKGSSSGVCSAGLFGAWENLVLALWGGADVLVDPYTGGAAGDVKVIVHQEAQVKNRHDEAFTRCVDILTN